MEIEAKDLMVGNWVKIHGENKPIRVKAVYPTMIIPNPKDDPVHAVIGDEYLEGIPLTYEILEKNGFVWRDDLTDDEMFMPAIIDKLNTDEFYEIVVEWRDSYDNGALDDFNREFWGECWKLHCMCGMKSFVIEGAKTIYVHELQNALKICGIKKEIEL